MACMLDNGWLGMVGGSGYCGEWVWLGVVAFASIDLRTYTSCADIMGGVWVGRIVCCWWC